MTADPLTFKPIDVDRHFAQCYNFRRDSWFCSFQSLDGFDDAIAGYRARIIQRMDSPQWFYRHLWQGTSIIGQLEFRTFSSTPETGYVQLFYLIPSLRGSGVASLLQHYVAESLREQGCHAAVLSVSRTNPAAIRHYDKWDWRYLAPNPKHAQTDFYQRTLVQPTNNPNAWA